MLSQISVLYHMPVLVHVHNSPWSRFLWLHHRKSTTYCLDKYCHKEESNKPQIKFPISIVIDARHMVLK